MRTHNVFMTCLATALVSMGAAQAESIGEPYYNPANQASETGKTIGSDLYKTIGCPGRGLLDPACQEDAPVVTVAAPAPAPEPAAAPALPAVPQAVAAPVEVPVVVATTPAAASATPASQPGNINFEECYTNMVKVTADNFRNSAAFFFKTPDAGQQ